MEKQISQFEKRFQIAYGLSTADPYAGIVWDAGLKYGRLIRYGASKEEIAKARDALMHYWDEWERNASAQVKKGKELFLRLEDEQNSLRDEEPIIEKYGDNKG